MGGLAATDDGGWRMSEDEHNLNLLSIFHYVFGGIYAFLSFFPLIYVALGIAMANGMVPADSKGEMPPAVLGSIFIAMGAVISILGWTYSIGMIVAGRMLRRRRAYVFCMVMAVLSCLHIPFGTCLGIFTIVVLSRSHTQHLFEAEKARMARLDPV